MNYHLPYQERERMIDIASQVVVRIPMRDSLYRPGELAREVALAILPVMHSQQQLYNLMRSFRNF